MTFKEAPKQGACFVYGQIVAILVTGGAGYIGSHTCIEIIRAGYNVSC